MLSVAHILELPNHMKMNRIPPDCAETDLELVLLRDYADSRKFVGGAAKA